jgi:hypothetical protein
MRMTIKGFARTLLVLSLLLQASDVRPSDHGGIGRCRQHDGGKEGLRAWGC